MKGEKKTDELRDPIVSAFRRCKVTMNKTLLNDFAVLYIKERVGISDFSKFVEEHSEKKEIDIEKAYEEALSESL